MESRTIDSSFEDFSYPYVPQETSTPKKPLSKIDASTSPLVKNDKGFSASLNKPHNQPLDMNEEELSTHLIKRKLNDDPEKSLVWCKTKGPPLFLRKVVAPRKDLSDTKSPTKRKRSKLLCDTRSFISGKEHGSHDKQIASEIKRIPYNRRQSIYSKAGVKPKIKISKEKSLAIKEALGLSWHQGRKQVRLFKDVGVHFVNESSVRDFSKEIVKDFVTVENRNFATSDGECAVPYGRINHLSQFLTNLLDSYDRNGQLTWYNDQIPHDEIWVKIGADHGKNSLKYTLQVANLAKPNAQRNTVVIAMAAVKDTFENMKSFLEGGLGEDICALKGHTWKEKIVKLFLNGDYEFLSKIYGLSGAQGTFPCLWCVVPKHAMKMTSAPYPTRSLETIQEDHNNFQKKEKGNKKEVSRYHNALHPPQIPIELELIAPPYLHILLGVVVKHHRLLETAAHEIDCILACQRDVYVVDETLKLYGNNWQKAVDLRQQIEFQETCLHFSETDDDITKHREQISSLKQTLSTLKHEQLQHRHGPVASSLDPILTKHRITPQAYHSRSFIGNHCHKYLVPAVHKELTDTIVQTTQQHTRDPFLIDHAHTLKLKFDDVNQLFGTVHSHVSHTRPIDKNSLPAIKDAIDSYLTFFRQRFPRKFIPKQHILEHHCVQFIERFGFGLGLLGEQGTEASHQGIAKIEKRACGIVNEVKRLEFIMKTHLLHVSPVLGDKK